MDEEIRKRFDALDVKTEATFRSAEKTRKYFLWVLVISLVVFALPLIGLFFAVPSMFSSYNELLTL